MVSRREFFVQSAVVLAGSAVVAAEKSVAQTSSRSPSSESVGSNSNTEGYHSVISPNGSILGYTVQDGVKVFHLIAEPVRREFAPGLIVNCWGYNGETPGPIIEVIEGDRCKFLVTNRLPEATSLHWHGVLLPNGMDGVAGLTQPYINPGETFQYEFTFQQAGTYMYHPHYDEMVQMGMGMMGMIVVHPRAPTGQKIDRDFGIMLSEWRIKPGTSRPDPMEMTDFNLLTMNGKAFPGTTPLMVKKGDRVRIRFGNLSAMDHHPIHLHGFHFKVVGTDGGPIPETAQWPETTVLVPVGSTRDIEFVADTPGDWPMHCHMTHHVMNQMGHGLPNMIGVKDAEIEKQLKKSLPHTMVMGTSGMGGMGEMMMPIPKNSIPMRGAPGPFGYIDMGGMFTIVKVRENLDEGADASWYNHPTGSVARKLSKEEIVAVLGKDVSDF